MNGLPYLSIMIFMPLVGAAFISLIRGNDKVAHLNAKLIALWTTSATFAVSLGIYWGFSPGELGYQYVENISWIPQTNTRYHLGIDGISLPLILLATFLFPLCILSCWQSIKNNIKSYLVLFLILETLVLGSFCALDLILFFFFFESVLVPMFLIIGMWGGERRKYSAYKFFIFTFAGSVFMLVAILVLYGEIGSTDVEIISKSHLSLSLQIPLWCAFMLSFAVKTPMWPLHTWLPDAHVEAPTSGSVILAGVLLKMGGYGFFRFLLPFFPEASKFFSPWVLGLSCIAVIYASIVALAQTDMKKLIAYSSVAHMGYVTAGVFSLNEAGLAGALFQMVSHGLISAGLFLCVGAIYDRYHSRHIHDYGGLAVGMPRYALFFVALVMGSVALPGTSAFVAEFLVLLGTFQKTIWAAVLMSLGIIFGAVYMLFLTKRILFGTKGPLVSQGAISDLTLREQGIFGLIVSFVIVLGLAPNFLIQMSLPSLRLLCKLFE